MLNIILKWNILFLNDFTTGILPVSSHNAGRSLFWENLNDTFYSIVTIWEKIEFINSHIEGEKVKFYCDIYILLHIYISYNIIKIFCYYTMFFGGRKKDICIYFLV